MNEERRNHDRSPSIRSVELITTDRDGNELSFPVILRDANGAGLGAVYIGQELLNTKRDYLLRDADGSELSIRIVWAKKVADYVQMLGLEKAEA